MRHQRLRLTMAAAVAGWQSPPRHQGGRADSHFSGHWCRRLRSLASSSPLRAACGRGKRRPEVQPAMANRPAMIGLAIACRGRFFAPRMRPAQPVGIRRSSFCRPTYKRSAWSRCWTCSSARARAGMYRNRFSYHSLSRGRGGALLLRAVPGSLRPELRKVNWASGTRRSRLSTTWSAAWTRH